MYNREINAMHRALKKELKRSAGDPRRISVVSGVVKAIATAIKECNPNFDDDAFVRSLTLEYEKASW